MAETTPVATTVTTLPSPDDDRAGVEVHPRAASSPRERTPLSSSLPAPRTAGRSTLRWRRSRQASKVPSVDVAAQLLAAARARAAAEPGRAGARRRHGALGPPGRRAVGHADRPARRGAAQRQRQRQRRRRRRRGSTTTATRTTTDGDEDEHPAHADKRVADRRAPRYESASIEPDSPGALSEGNADSAPGALARESLLECPPRQPASAAHRHFPSRFMAETTPVAEPATLPSTEEIERASAFAREPFLPEGEDAASRARPGHAAPPRAGRRARGARGRREGPVAALAAPVVAAARPRAPALAGRAAPRRRHRPLRPPGRRALGHADRAARRSPQERRRAVRTGRRAGAGRRRAAASRARRTTRTTRTSPRSRRTGTTGRGRGRGRRRGARGPERRQALLVRARDRRRQDGRRRRLRRGLAHRRHPDPHPPPQPRRPVPRRAARPRLREADRARAARATRTRPTAR